MKIILLLIACFVSFGCTTPNGTDLTNLDRMPSSVSILPEAYDLWEQVGARTSKCTDEKDNLSVALDLRKKQHNLACYSVDNYGVLQRCIYKVRESVPGVTCYRTELNESFMFKFKSTIENNAKDCFGKHGSS